MHYTLEIEIDQPREKVAELFGNPENLGYWQPGFVQMDPIEGEAEKTRLLYLNRGREVEMIDISRLVSPRQCSGRSSS